MACIRSILRYYLYCNIYSVHGIQYTRITSKALLEYCCITNMYVKYRTSIIVIVGKIVNKKLVLPIKKLNLLENNETIINGVFSLKTTNIMKVLKFKPAVNLQCF